MSVDTAARAANSIKHTKLFIDGKFVDALDGAEFETINPSTGEVITRVAEAKAADVDRAVAAARKAFDSGPWRTMTPAKRAAALWRLGDLLLENAENLATIETLDQGKPFWLAEISDIPSAAGLFHYMSGWATKIEGNTIPISAPGNYHAYTRREPIGVIGLIVPWNFPLVITSWKVAPALAAGNTVVIKPAEQTPLSALALAELALEAGIPPGVLNVVPGFGSTAGAALTAHPDVDKVSFTGSTATGRRIMEAAQGNLKKLTLELGGKSANIIFPDADLERAISGSKDGIFFNAGQACAAGSRIYVHEAIFDEFVGGLKVLAEGIKVGDGFDPTSEIGPLASLEHFDRVSGYLASGISEGATAITGGVRVGEEGYFIAPTIFTDAAADSTIIQEEIFGPVVVATKFRDIDEVVALANNTRFGLAAGIWSKDVSTVHSMAARLRAGTVWANCYGVFDPALPFGGYKESGWGREMGHEVLNYFTEVKTVIVSVDE